tara:strand:+ start:171 stop:1391 length:1221 start_codon:yes stop_codon:yes gene_type:complete
MAVTKITDENIIDIDASKLVGSLGVLDGSNLTNVPQGKVVTKETSDPTQETNPAGGVGTLYLNKSSGELFCCTDATTDYNVWLNVGNPEKPTGIIQFDNSGPQYFGNRGLFFGGNWTQMTTDAIQYINIPICGNSTTFGDLNRYHQSRPGCLSDGTRAVCVAGNMDGPNTGMDYVTVATPATSQEFGTFAYSNTYLDAVSNGTRGLITPGAYGSASMPMEYITVQTTGNSQTFGSVVFSNGSYDQHCGWMPVVGNGTRAIMLGGYPHTPNGPLIGGIISYVVIATQSNASQFGTLDQHRYGAAGLNDRTYGVCWGGQYVDNGYIPAGNEWITMATNGNAQIFSGITVSHQNDTGACSNSERGVIQMYTNNEIEFITITNPSANAIVFGQNSISSNQSSCGATSGNA